MTGGISVKRSPIRAFYFFTPGSTSTVEAGFSVTRSIRNAASRNFVKRRLREDFRNNCNVLFGNNGFGGTLKLVLLYTERTANVRKEIKHKPLNTSINAILEMIRRQLTALK
jgi:RNase P protein component